MLFGDPLTTASGQSICVYLATLPNSRIIVWWNRQLRQCEARNLRQWVCPTCKSSVIWWSLTDRPVCARCTPMPPDMLQRAWHEAQAFITYLADGKDPDTKTLMFAELDRAIVSGDLNELLRLCIAQHAMWRKINQERAAQEREDR